MAKKNYATAVIKVKLNWVYLNAPREDEDRFQVDCCNLSPADIKKLQDIGIGHRVRTKSDREEDGSFITVKSNVKAEQYRKGDDDLRWFNVTDANRLPVDLSVLGKGSEALVKVAAVPYNNKKGEGLKADIRLVVITKLVEYSGGEAHDDVYAAAGNLPEMEEDVAEDVAEDVVDAGDDGWDTDDADV